MNYSGRKVSQKPQYTKSEKNTSEDTLQEFAEKLCTKLGLTFLHIPASVYKNERLRSTFSGVPDLLIFGNDLSSELFTQTLLLELKIVGKKKRPTQTKWLKGLVHHVPNTKDEIEEKIMEFYHHCNRRI